MENKLYRDEQRKVIGGVCGGLAHYFNLDIVLVRVIFLFAFFFLGTGFLVYIVLWIVLPRNSYVPGVDYVDYTVPAPSQYPPYKKSGSGKMIGGLTLILFGVYFLLDQFDFIPNWDFDKLWPLVLIIIGLVIIFGRKRMAPGQMYTTEQNQFPNDSTTL